MEHIVLAQFHAIHESYVTYFFGIMLRVVFCVSFNLQFCHTFGNNMTNMIYMVLEQLDIISRYYGYRDQFILCQHMHNILQYLPHPSYFLAQCGL